LLPSINPLSLKECTQVFESGKLFLILRSSSTRDVETKEEVNKKSDNYPKGIFEIEILKINK